MFCENCGTQLNDNMVVCPNCGTSATGSQQTYTEQFDNSTYYEQPTQPIKTTSFLVWSIVELLCVNSITGLIGIILYCAQLKPAADKGDLQAVKKSKKNIKIALWIGFGLWVLTVIGTIIAMIIAVALPLNSASNTRGIENDRMIKELNSHIQSIESLDNNLTTYNSYID